MVNLLGETGISSTPLIVGTTTTNDATASVENEIQSEPRHPPLLWSDAYLRIDQSKDKHLNAVLQRRKAGRRPPREEMEVANQHMWSLWSHYHRLLLQDEVLLQLCVPQYLKGDLPQELHYHCGHLSVCTTTDNMRQYVYWFAHTADIELYCRTCHTRGPELNQFLN